MSTVTLSRSLERMADVFSGHPEIHMDGLSAGQFTAALSLLAAQARLLEADIDRLTWALGAARDPHRNSPEIMERALDEIARMLADDPPPPRPPSPDFAAIEAGLRDGRVTLFPAIKRPAFSDGREPHGGQA